MIHTGSKWQYRPANVGCYSWALQVPCLLRLRRKLQCWQTVRTYSAHTIQSTGCLRDKAGCCQTLMIFDTGTFQLSLNWFEHRARNNPISSRPGELFVVGWISQLHALGMVTGPPAGSTKRNWTMIEWMGACNFDCAHIWLVRLWKGKEKVTNRIRQKKRAFSKPRWPPFDGNFFLC